MHRSSTILGPLQLVLLVSLTCSAGPLEAASGPQPTNTPWRGTCTLWIGFSQVADWYKAGMPACFTDPSQAHHFPDARTELRWCQGCGVERWAMTPGPTPTTGPATPTPVMSAWDASCTAGLGQTGCYFSACTSRSQDPDRVVFVVTDALIPPNLEVADDYQPYLTGAIDNIRAAYPHVEQIILQTVIGGPGHAVCYCSEGGPCGATPVSTPVRASVNHPVIDVAIAQWLAAHPEQADVIQGPSPEVDDCDEFADLTGHLTTTADCPLANQIAADYEPVATEGTVGPTATATPTFAQTPSPTPSAPATASRTRTPSETPAPTITPSPSRVASATQTAAPPTASPASSATATSTSTPTPSATVTVSATAAATMTPTSSPSSATATETAATRVPTPTITATQRTAPTSTENPTTATSTPIFTATATLEPTARLDTPSPTGTSAVTPTIVPDPTAPSAVPSPTPTPCPGSCDGRSPITPTDLLTGVEVALLRDPATACAGMDFDNSHSVTVDELVVAVRNMISGCVGSGARP